MSLGFLQLWIGSNRGAPVTDINPVPVKVMSGGGGGTGGAITSVDLGVKADPAATSDDGSFSLIALFKRAMTYWKNVSDAAVSTAPTIVVQEAPSWVYIPAGQTDTAGGNANDLLDCLLVIPATTSPGAVSVEDGAGTNYTLFAGGPTSVSTLIPFPIDMRNIQATTAWEISTGANVAVIAFYRPRT